MAVQNISNSTTNLTELQRLRDLGRYYLQSNKIDQALQTVVALLEQFPEDIGSIVILGDSYLMAGDPAAAKDLYQVALDLAPDRQDVRHRIQLAENTVSTEMGIAGGFPPLHPQAVNRLIERLTGKSAAFDEQQINRAAELLEKTIHSASPATSVSEHLEEIDALLPAILELNIRQARSQGQADLAAELVDLQNSLLKDKNKPGSNDDSFIATVNESKMEKETIRAILIGEPSQHSPYRQQVIAAALRHAGMVVEEEWENLPLPWDGFDLVVAHNPHKNPVFMKAIAAWAGAGNPLLVDMDVDFRTEYPGGSSESRAFTAAIEMANVLTFPSTKTALDFSTEGYRALTVPEGWSQKNSLWLKNVPVSDKVSLGLFTHPGRTEDAATIRRAVIRVLREFPQTRLVISGDPDVYPLFDSIADTRRVYLPSADVDDYPYLLGQADIHLLPFVENEANRGESDRRFMECGVRKIAWVASPIPAAEEWNAGGFIALSVDDWYSHLKTLIQDVDLRMRLAMEGYQKAQERETGKQSEVWSTVVHRTMTMFGQKPIGKEGE